MFVLGLDRLRDHFGCCAPSRRTHEMLIAARAAQGLTGALLVPGSLAILAATFEGAERGKAVGTWTAWTGIATVLGPAGGGALIEALSWRAIFWVNIPLIVVTVLLTLHSVEESSDPEADRAIDWVGIVLSAAGLGGPVFALIQQPTHGWGDPMVYVPLIGGVLLFAAFLLWESRYKHAMLDLSLFRIRNFCGDQPRDADRLLGPDRGVLLRHAVPPADDRLHATRGRPRDDADLRRSCSSSRRTSASSRWPSGRGCRWRSGRSSAASACCSSPASTRAPTTSPACFPGSCSSASGSRRPSRR